MRRIIGLISAKSKFSKTIIIQVISSNKIMTIDEHIKHWTDGAKSDLDAAFDVFSVNRYDWSLFIGHLALEKLLKAIYIQNTNNTVPPKIHNLRKLAEISELDLNQEQLIFLDKIFKRKTWLR